MEATFTLLRENAPFAVITLLAVLYLDSNMDQQTVEIRGDIAGLSERMARVETKVDGLDYRMGGMEKRMDGLETRMTGMETRMTRMETNLAQ